MPAEEAAKTTSILIADDDVAIRSMIRQILAHEGYTVAVAPDGAEAIKLIRELKPDLILTDVKMPNMDGYQVCQAVKGDPALKHIPILVLTVLDRNEERVKGLDAGADDFINKPFNQAELLARVRAFLRTKSLHDELQRSYVRLKELETMRDALTGMIIHDLKSPLNVISGSIQVSLDSFVENKIGAPEDIRLLKNAENSCRIMMGLLNDILDVSRMEQRQLPLKKEKVSLEKIVGDCMDLMEPLRIKYDVAFIKDFETGLPQIEVDQVLIQRVVTNIFSNSLKFTPPEGSITAHIKKVGNELEISIQDTGIGIPDKYIDKIFEKFFQGDAMETTRKGQGVGLTFCRMAIDAHDGKIWAESKENEGSSFIIRLPLAA